jgi:sugar transferase (PEP-CTERM/EpsH1 system associated)
MPVANAHCSRPLATLSANEGRTVSRKPGRPATVVHIVFRFDYGGLENGVVNILNGLADENTRHVVIALTEATNFAERLPGGVDVHSIHKQAGKDPKAYVRLYHLLRRIRPDVVHSRNFGTIECAFVAFLAGVPVRIHSEHGWDVFDPDGTRPKFRWMRRAMAPFIHRFVTVSEDLASWLVGTVRISKDKVEPLHNGVDTRRFQPRAAPSREGLPEAIAQGDVVIGSVTRFSAIKDPLNLVRAFIALRRDDAQSPEQPVLAMLGHGELHDEACRELERSGLRDLAWLPGARDEVAELMRSMDVFVLGSLREGISNTILEAMATGLPIVASDTGGNRELVADGVNGFLVEPGDPAGLADAIRRYLGDPGLRERHGAESRRRACSEFSLDAMIGRYRSLYEQAISKAAG